MIALAYIWAWLLLGVAIGRMLFVRILADRPRREARTRHDERGRPIGERAAWSDAFVRALWTGLACVIAWPITLPLALMLAQTGTEKLRTKRERLAAEVARLEKQL